MVVKIDIRSCCVPLTGGRACVHVEGHAIRHSHTWHYGDARYAHIEDYLIDMETGEVAGEWRDDTSRVIAEVRQVSRTREDSLRVLRNHLPGFREPSGELPALRWDDLEGKPMDINFHYHGESGWSYGTTTAGHNVEVSPAGKVKRIYSLNERAEVVTFAGRVGPGKASKKFDIPAGTIRSWMGRK
jgi:hypothetical protein